MRIKVKKTLLGSTCLSYIITQLAIQRDPENDLFIQESFILNKMVIHKLKIIHPRTQG